MADGKVGSYRGFTEAQARAHKKYISRFVEVKIRMDPDRRDIIKAHAALKDGGSVNAFINRAIDETIERDGADGSQEITGQRGKGGVDHE